MYYSFENIEFFLWGSIDHSNFIQNKIKLAYVHSSQGIQI